MRGLQPGITTGCPSGKLTCLLVPKSFEGFRRLFTLDWSGLLWIAAQAGKFEGFSGFLWVLMGSYGFLISAVAALPPSPGYDATRLARHVRFGKASRRDGNIPK